MRGKQTPAELRVCCACSTGLPFRSHFVDRSRRSERGGSVRHHEGAPDRGVRARGAVRPNVGTTRRMGSIGRYIFRNAMGAFVLVLVSLTAAIWLTQALRDIDLITSQGPTILVFIGITGLIIPVVVRVS